jgi:hypothetical protein
MYIVYIEPSIAGLCSLLCFSSWVAPLIPDYSDIGAYSKSITARIYKQVGTHRVLTGYPQEGG